MTSAGPLKLALMTRHKQEREGPPLPRREHSLHHKQQAGGCSTRTESGHCPCAPPSSPLSPCQRTLPHTRAQATGVHFTSGRQGKQTGATSVSKEAVVFAVRVRNLLVGESQQPPHPTSPCPFKHSDNEPTFQDTDTVVDKLTNIPVKFFLTGDPP